MNFTSIKNFFRSLAFLGLVGCAGLQRDCVSFDVKNYGTDWIIVQYNCFGQPFNCWELHNISVDDEPNSDGVYWESAEGHLNHISGFYNRVQVSNHNFENAAKTIGIDLKYCSDGKYLVKDDKATLIQKPIENHENKIKNDKDQEDPLKKVFDGQ